MGKSRLSKLILSPEQKQQLAATPLSHGSRTGGAASADSAAVSRRRDRCEHCAKHEDDTKERAQVGGERLSHGSGGGPEGRLSSPHAAVTGEDAKAWVVHLACCKPKDLGYAAELWTRSALAPHSPCIRNGCSTTSKNATRSSRPR